MKYLLLLLITFYSFSSFSQTNNDAEIKKFVNDYALTYTLFAKTLDVDKVMSYYSKDVKCIRTVLFSSEIEYYDYEGGKMIAESYSYPYDYGQLKKVNSDMRDYYALNSGGILFKVDKKSLKVKVAENMAYCYFVSEFSATKFHNISNLKSYRVTTLLLVKENNSWKIYNENVIDLIGKANQLYHIHESYSLELNELDKLLNE